MATVSDLNTSTRSGSTGGAEFDYVIPEQWQQDLPYDLVYQSWLHQWEGGEYKNYKQASKSYKESRSFGKRNKKGVLEKNFGMMTGMPIVTKGDAFVKRGDTIHFSPVAPFVPVFKKNEATLRSNETKISFGQFDLGVDVYRAATAFTETLNELTFVDNPALAYHLLSVAGGRKRDENIFKTLLFSSPTTGATSYTVPTIYAGGKSSSETVVDSTSAFSIQEIKKGYARLKDQGAMPISYSKVKMGRFSPTREIPEYALWLSEVDLYNLKNDAEYDNYVVNAGERGSGNPVFSSPVLKIDNLWIYAVPSPNQGRRIGSPLRPEATLQSGTGTGTGTWTFGSDDKSDYLPFWPDDGQVVVYDDSGTAIEVATYSSKTDYTITISDRADLGTATNHASGTKVSLVTGRALFMGGNAVCTGLGKPARFIKEDEDYKEQKGIGVRFTEGYQVVLDSSGTPNNYVVLETYSPRDF